MLGKQLEAAVFQFQEIKNVVSEPAGYAARPINIRVEFNGFRLSSHLQNSSLVL